MDTDTFPRVLCAVADEALATRLGRVLGSVEGGVEYVRVATPEAFDAELSAGVDGLFVDTADPVVELSAVRGVLASEGVDVPVVALCRDPSSDELEVLMKAGVDDWVDVDDLTRITFVVRRVAREGQVRRRLQQVERDREADRARHEAVLATLRDHVVVLDARGRIVDANEAWRTFARANGDPELQATGVGASYLDECERAVQRGDAGAGEVLEGIRRVLHGEAPHFDYAYPCHAPGRRRWFSMSVRPLDAGEGVVVTHVNETASHDSEAQEQHPGGDVYKQRLAAIVESSNDAIIGTTLDGTIQSWNGAAERLYGYAADDIIGQSVDRIVPQDRRNELDGVIMPGGNGQLTKQFDSMGLRSDGNLLDVSINVSTVEDESGQAVGLALIARDVSMRKRFVREVLAAKRKEQEVRRFKAAFMASMSHEIRTPLTGIIGFADMLDDVVAEEHREFTGYIRQHSERLMKTLTDVLDLAEVESGSYDYRPVTARLSDVVEEQAGDWKRYAKDEGLALTLEVTESDAYVHVDPSSLATALRHVVDNAIKFTEAGSVSVVVEADDSHVHLRVVDTGIGIEEAFLPDVFEAYAQQSDGEDRGAEGSGLGLAIVHRLTELMEGEISIDSTAGEGTIVVLRLPRHEPPPAATETPAEEPAAVAEASDAIGVDDDVTSESPARVLPRVLIVDDDQSSRNLMEMMLQSDFDVEVASGTDEALEHVEAGRFDVFVLDINLNEQHTGAEVLHALRSHANGRATPVVGCSGHALPGDEDRFLNAGFQGYIGKPVKKTPLIQIVRAALEADMSDSSGAGESEADIDVLLPPLPRTMPAVIELRAGTADGPEVERLEQVLEMDPVTASWVLRRVNSAYYGLRQTVSSIDRAVTLLGFEPVCDLVLMEVLRHTFSDVGTGAPNRVYERLMRISIGAAVFARALSKAIGLGDSEEVFAAGMLHQIGRLAMLSSEPEAYTAIWETPNDDGVGNWAAPATKDELTAFGIDHRELAVTVLRQWELSDSLFAPALYYERPEKARNHPNKALVLLIATGYRAAHWLTDHQDPDAVLPSEVVGRSIPALAEQAGARETEIVTLLREQCPSVREFMDAAFHA